MGNPTDTSKKSGASGIPAEITLEFARNWVKPRVSARRFEHIEGVVETAAKLAQAADCDLFPALLAGYLHDACKEWKEKDLVDFARKNGMKVSELEEKSGHLLHGPAAAIVAKQELGITNKNVLNAIAEHTLGAVPMSRLSQVVYLADCLEASRPSTYTEPIWAALDLEHGCHLEQAMVVASDLGITHLIQSGRYIHPKAVKVRNYFLEQTKKHALKK